MRVIKDTKFRGLMQAAGLGDIILVKDHGYFFITSDKDDSPVWRAPETSICVNSFKDMTPEDWVKEIDGLLQKI